MRERQKERQRERHTERERDKTCSRVSDRESLPFLYLWVCLWVCLSVTCLSVHSIAHLSDRAPPAPRGCYRVHSITHSVHIECTLSLCAHRMHIECTLPLCAHRVHSIAHSVHPLYTEKRNKRESGTERVRKQSKVVRSFDENK